MGQPITAAVHALALASSRVLGRVFAERRAHNTKPLTSTTAMPVALSMARARARAAQAARISSAASVMLFPSVWCGCRVCRGPPGAKAGTGRGPHGHHAFCAAKNLIRKSVRSESATESRPNAAPTSNVVGEPSLTGAHAGSPGPLGSPPVAKLTT